jgi:KDO2-lipid IV(A) lauroyltransferase
MTGAPVIMVFCRMESDGRYHLEFFPAFQVPADAPEKGETGAWVRHFLEILEGQVRRYPANSNDYFFWDGSGSLVA